MKESTCKTGWLTAVGDPQLGAAFQKIHAHPEAAWTVESLAQTAAMSRSAFAARFKDVVGLAPLAYLTRWRMHRATEMLGASTQTVGEIALAVGYETESAFAKVFRRHLGTTPGTYRRQRRAPTPDGVRP